MTPDKWAALRAPFPPEQIGKLPRLTCAKCREARGKVCDEHKKSKCQVCGNFISSAHIHLDYVGHAAATDRLLQVDPTWTWRPMAATEDEMPMMVLDGLLPDEQIGMWIELTVLGVTRPGFGGGKNIKEAIGDAIRNAAMRFGVALDLWAKEDLHASEPAEVRKEGGLGDAPVPRSWAKVKEWYEKYGDWSLAELLIRACSYHLYGEVESKKLTPDQRKVLLQKASGATVWLAENSDNVIGPLPPSVELYQKAWAHVLDGTVLEVPEWQPKEMPLYDEAEMLADAAITGAG